MQDVAIRVMTGPVKQLEGKLCSLRDEFKLLPKTYGEVMRSYGEAETVVNRSIKKVYESFCTRVFGISECLSKATPKRCLLQISTLKHFCEYLCHNCTRRQAQSSTDDIEVKEGECVVALEPFLLVCIAIYKPLRTSRSATLVRLTKAQFESPVWVASFETKVARKGFVCDVSSTAVLKNRP